MCQPPLASPVSVLLIALSLLWSLACGPRQVERPKLVACTATRELLKNGGFESGSLDGFVFRAGKGTVVERVGNASCHEPGAAAAPHRGRYAFSMAAEDGADASQSEIGLRQAVNLQDLGLAPGDYISASAFVAGSCDQSADSGSTLMLFFMKGGADGQELDQASSTMVDPTQGQWQQLITRPTQVPAGADTIDLVLRSNAPWDKTRIQMWADDLSLAVCGAGEELEAWQPLEASRPEATVTMATAADSSAAPDSAAPPVGPDAQPQPQPLSLPAPAPAGDYELAYSVRHWQGEYGIWFGKPTPAAGEAATRIEFDPVAGAITLSHGGKTTTVSPMFGLPISARVRLVRTGERLLLYLNEELMFAKPAPRDEGDLGFLQQGDAPRVSELSLRPLTNEEVATYRATPDTPSAAAAAEEKRREAAAKEPTFRWSSRLTFDLGDNHGASFKKNEAAERNGFEVLEPRLEVARMQRLAGPLYYAYGVNAGYFSATSSTCDGAVVCTTPEECTCQQGGARWSTRGVSYGATAALALPGLDSNRQGVIVWLPILRANHLLTTPAKVECKGASDCPEAAWSFAGARLEASAGIDWIYKGIGGCGPRVSFGYYFGDVAKRQDLGLVVTWGLSFHVETLDL